MRADLRAQLVAMAHLLADAIEDARTCKAGETELFRTKGPRAPGITRRTHNETLRSGRVAGAYKDGREWVCSRAAWFAARARRPEPKPQLRLVQPAAPTDAERARELLNAAGFRATRRGQQ